MKSRWILAMLAVVATGCNSPTAPCPASRSLTGAWRYVGERDAPVPARYDGTLEVTSESCEGFHGRLDLIQSDAVGSPQRLAGLVTGRLTSNASVHFDAWLGVVPWQHVASLDDAGGEGQWVLVSGAAAPESGTFRLTRTP